MIEFEGHGTEEGGDHGKMTSAKKTVERSALLLMSGNFCTFTTASQRVDKLLRRCWAFVDRRIEPSGGRIVVRLYSSLGAKEFLACPVVVVTSNEPFPSLRRATKRNIVHGENAGPGCYPLVDMRLRLLLLLAAHFRTRLDGYPSHSRLFSY